MRITPNTNVRLIKCEICPIRFQRKPGPGRNRKRCRICQRHYTRVYMRTAQRNRRRTLRRQT